MQSLAQNRQKIYYATLESITDRYDSDGYLTGEKDKTYTSPQEFLIYVSPARGSLGWYPFGIGENYTNVMSTCDRDCPINEESVLWIGIDPQINESGKATIEHNYIVERVAIGLNSILYAIRKVDSGPVPGSVSA